MLTLQSGYIVGLGPPGMVWREDAKGIKSGPLH